MFDNIHPVDFNTDDISEQYDSVSPNSSKMLIFKATADKSACKVMYMDLTVSDEKSKTAQDV